MNYWTQKTQNQLRSSLRRKNENTAITKAYRQSTLMPDCIPRYIRVYDNGGLTADRYTVVFTGRYWHRTDGEYWYLGMSENPSHPQGVGTRGTSKERIDKPSYAHLGEKLDFKSLPEDCQQIVIQMYKELWNLD